MAPGRPGGSARSDRSGRVVGLDVARCLALLGMVAVHVLPERAPGGDLTAAHWLAGGRASALFAVLAGVTLALLTGGDRRRCGVRDLLAIAVRALLVATLGLALGGLDSGLAVILTYYGVLFLLGLPFVGLGPRALLVMAAGWAVAAPVVSHLVRPTLPPRTFDVPSFASLADPGALLSDLLLTGYYPAVPWLTYLLAGMAVGRLDLRSPAVAVRLALGGLAAAVTALAVSATLLSMPALRDPLAADPLGATDDVLRDAAGGMAGVTPTDGPWQWLLVAAPHSATPFDLVQTTGSALAVVGLCLLVVGALRGRIEHAVAVFFGAGTMTLTLYSLHVLLRTETLWPPDHGDAAFRWHVLVLLSFGAIFVAVDAPGPFEWFVRRVTRTVRAGRLTTRRRP